MEALYAEMAASSTALAQAQADHMTEALAPAAVGATRRPLKPAGSASRQSEAARAAHEAAAEAAAKVAAELLEEEEEAKQAAQQAKQKGAARKARQKQRKQVGVMWSSHDGAGLGALQCRV